MPNAILLLIAAEPLLLHLEADRPGVELRSAGSDAVICSAPCDRALAYDARDQFVLAGEEIARSDAFHFARPGQVALSVHSGSRARATGGKMAVVFGVLGLIGGAVLENYATAVDVNNATEGLARSLGCLFNRNCQQGPSEDTTSLHTSAYVSVGVGVAAIVAGLLLSRSAETTWTSVRDGPEEKASPQPPREGPHPALQQAHQPPVEESPLEAQQKWQ